MPTAWFRTSTWPGPGGGVGTSSIFNTDGPPYSETRIAFILCVLQCARWARWRRAGAGEASPPASSGRSFVGSAPSRVECVSRRVEIDHERRMIGGDGLALAGLAIDLGSESPIGHRRGHEQVIDAHAEVLVEVAGAVVPPGVAAALGVVKPVGIDEAPAPQPGEGFALGRRHVRPPVAGLRIPDVGILGSDVEVTSQDEGARRITGLAEPAGQTLVPDELGLVERRAHYPAVRRIEADQADAPAH